jgi:aryl-alcohol dehydrogenase-like predicted oxidoreductase
LTMPDLAMRFVLSNPDVSVVIPGMRKPKNVRANIVSSEAGPLPPMIVDTLRKHRWDRKPTAWSQ